MRQYKIITLSDDFRTKITPMPIEHYESNRSYYIKQGLAFFGLMVCIFLLILDFEWMAGRL